MGLRESVVFKKAEKLCAGYSGQEGKHEQWLRRKDFGKYYVQKINRNRDHVKEQNGNEIIQVISWIIENKQIEFEFHLPFFSYSQIP